VPPEPNSPQFLKILLLNELDLHSVNSIHPELSYSAHYYSSHDLIEMITKHAHHTRCYCWNISPHITRSANIKITRAHRCVAHSWFGGWCWEVANYTPPLCRRILNTHNLIYSIWSCSLLRLCKQWVWVFESVSIFWGTLTAHFDPMQWRAVLVTVPLALLIFQLYREPTRLYHISDCFQPLTIVTNCPQLLQIAPYCFAFGTYGYC
jgi:hypothetical protein